jgi:hypothetical protein
MRLKTWTTGAVAAVCLTAAVAAGGQEGAKEQLRIALKDTEVKGNWIYDDLAAGYSAAKKAGKPMMIVFR